MLEELYLDTLTRVLPEKIVYNAVEPRADDMGFAVPAARFNVKLEPAPRSRLWVFGAGKAAVSMARGLLAKLESQVFGGIIIAPAGVEAGVDRIGPIRVARGTHPDPSELSIKATDELLEAAGRCSPQDHVLFLLSGGASALLCKPAQGLQFYDKLYLAQALMSAGAPIEEINLVRKHLSQVKGGQLARAFKCEVTALVLSDVASNSFEVIGSGPLYADSSTVDQALAILRKHFGEAGAFRFVKFMVETPKPGEGVKPVRHVLLASGKTLARVCGSIARQKDSSLEIVVQETPVTADVELVAKEYAGRVADYQARVRQGKAAVTPQLYVGFGEPTVRTGGGRKGRGGRNQHLALLLASLLSEQPGWQFLSGASDGIDGNTPAAGAVVDGLTWGKALELGLNPAKSLENFDSSSVLGQLKATLNPGFTGNNLQDLHLLLLR